MMLLTYNYCWVSPQVQQALAGVSLTWKCVAQHLCRESWQAQVKLWTWIVWNCFSRPNSNNHIDNLYRHLGSLTAANCVSFDFNVSYSSCWGYSLINTLKLKIDGLKLQRTTQMINFIVQFVFWNLKESNTLCRLSQPKMERICYGA